MTSPGDVDSEAERVVKRIDGAGFVQCYTLGTPIRFSITGYKYVGASKVKIMDVLVLFLPEFIRATKKLKTANINQSRRSLYHFRIVDGVDLTKVEQKEGFPYLKLVYPCVKCNLEKVDAGHDCAVQVNINEFFNGLMNKQKYMEYQMNCESASLTSGSAIFFTLKKPQLDCCII